MPIMRRMNLINVHFWTYLKLPADPRLIGGTSTAPVQHFTSLYSRNDLNKQSRISKLHDRVQKLLV